MAEKAVAAPTPAPEPVAPPPAPAADSKGEPKAAPAPTAAEIRKLKMKLADKEIELPEADILEIASQKTSTFIEAQKAAEELERLKTGLKSNWRQLLKEQGIDVREAILKEFGDELEAQADEQTLSPEAKELKALKAQLAEQKKAQEAAKAEEEKAANAKKTEQAKARLRATVEETLKVGNLSASNFVRGLVLEKLRFNASHGLPIHPTVLAAEVRETLSENFQEWLSGLSVDQVWAASEKFPEFRKEFVKRFAQLKGAKAAPAAPPKQAPKAEAKPKKRTAIEEAKRLNEAFKRGVG